MDNFILFLSTSDIPACQIPFVLQIIYFGKILINIVHILIPICLIVYMLIEFSKCVINGDESSQSKIVKLSFKRIIYAILVFTVPYIVSLCMTILSDLVPDYSLCITNATPENIEVFTAQYEAALEKEEAEREDAWVQSMSNKFVVSNYNKLDFYTNYNNLMQCKGDWSDYPVCGRERKTICTSGCGYVAYTMVVRSFGYANVTPDQIVDIVCNEMGYEKNAASLGVLTNNILNDKFGLEGKSISRKNAEQALKDGKSLIILMPGHWISVLGINSDGTVIVGDSYFPFAGTNEYTIDSLYEATANYREPYGWHAVIAYSKK